MVNYQHCDQEKHSSSEEEVFSDSRKDDLFNHSNCTTELKAHYVEFGTIKKYTLGRGISLWASNNSDISSLCSWIIRHGLPTKSTSNTELLKDARQRLIIRLKFAHGAHVIKMFPLRNPISMLKHKKYALREFNNYRQAAKRGIAVPIIYAFIRVRKLGFVISTGVIIEDLGIAPNAKQVASEIGYLGAAKACITAICTLFVAGVNHVDCRDENLIFTKTGVRVIDWQYASFVTPRSDWLLAYLATYFIRKAPVDMQASLLKDWLPDLYTAAEPKCCFELFNSRVRTLMLKRPSVSARLRLKPYKKLL